MNAARKKKRHCSADDEILWGPSITERKVVKAAACNKMKRNLYSRTSSRKEAIEKKVVEKKDDRKKVQKA